MVVDTERVMPVFSIQARVKVVAVQSCFERTSSSNSCHLSSGILGFLPVDCPALSSCLSLFFRAILLTVGAETAKRSAIAGRVAPVSSASAMRCLKSMEKAFMLERVS